MYLLLRVGPVLRAAPIVAAFGVAVGVSTAVYAAMVARTHTDAKGALAHATLSQIGLILAEISLGWTTLALVHLVCHALLRAWQFLRAPNTIHDAHAFGHHAAHATQHAHGAQAIILPPAAPAGPIPMRDRIFAHALHRVRLDERIDAAVAPVLVAARVLANAERRVRQAMSIGEERR